LRLGAKQVASGPSGHEKDPKKGPDAHYIDYDRDNTLAHFKNLLSCLSGRKDELVCTIFLCQKGDPDCSNDEDGPFSKYRGNKKRMLKKTSSFLQGEKKGADSPDHENSVLSRRSQLASPAPC
jgi:hypothetical protein